MHLCPLQACCMQPIRYLEMKFYAWSFILRLFYTGFIIGLCFCQCFSFLSVIQSIRMQFLEGASSYFFFSCNNFSVFLSLQSLLYFSLALQLVLSSLPKLYNLIAQFPNLKFLSSFFLWKPLPWAITWLIFHPSPAKESPDKMVKIWKPYDK